jgi:acyl transferase domain-containing protein/NADPH:quinone reductase-like Zn-dependent oxidoreductase/NADP-dependent 3-hydroxy acid dehydrogenase YdfG
MSAVRRALMAEEVREQALPLLRLDPIAIIGMACRAPGGARDPDTLWRLLTAGKTTAQEIPIDRFDAATWHDADLSAPGKIAAIRGSFLDQIDQFDPEYFGIPPREVEQMDPQQRLALEVAVEAIDDAGIPYAALRGSRSGVFMACYHDDYARLVYENVEALDTRTLTGTLHAVTANRISHFLDLRGPSLALDTACSSSLVAIHLACQSLRMGETDFALAGGVSVMITPELFVAMSKVGFMAPDGQCKTFDAAANGFGRGEGCGMVALKRLSDAVADGDRVFALIRGSAVNQDGRSTVLTAPNGQAQEAMLREALENAALSPERISFVETHGTGTALGDPIEVEALVNVLGGKAEDTSCYLGSLKANIGHLEAAAGVTGLIKVVQVLRHGKVPAQPNFHKLSPHISLAGSRLAVPTALTPLPPTDGPRFASVSSFGVGGTNAHVIVEEAPVLPPREPVAEGAIWTLPLSARTPEGLRNLVGQWIERLDGDGLIGDLCFTAALRRNHYPVRLAVAGRTKAELRERLAAFDGGAAAAVAPKVGFVFSGQGPQWWAMGRGLLETEPVFRAALEACDAAIGKASGWSVLEELRRPEAETRVAETRIAQVALFALQTALAALWASWGVKPAAVVGHSVGEIAALHVSGALSLEEAARIVVLRGEAMQARTGVGAMAAVSLTQGEAQEIAAAYPGRLDLAAVNAPRSAVLSGEPDALAETLVTLAARGVTVRPMQVEYAFHSSQMAAPAEAFRKMLGPVTAAPSVTPVFSTLSGAILAETVDADHFSRAICKPVRFADAIVAMRRAGVDAIVEIGPHPALAAAISETLEAAAPRVIAASLRRGRDEAETIRAGLAALYTAGLDPTWAAVQPGEGSAVSLPAYPWARRRLWLKAPGRVKARAGSGDWIGAPKSVAGTGLTIVPLDALAAAHWMADHQLFGEAFVPAAAMIHAMARAASAALRGQRCALEDFVINGPLRIDGRDDELQVVVTDAGAVTLYARGSRLADWRLIAEARAVPADEPPQPAAARALEAADLADFYDRMAANGATFGPAFKRLLQPTVREDGAEARAVLPDRIGASVMLHPTLLDAGIQLVSLASRREGVFLPLSIDRVWLNSTPCADVDIMVQIASHGPTAISADILAYSKSGALVAALQGVNLVKASAAALRIGGKPADFHELEWAPVASNEAPPKSWLILDDAGGVGTALETALSAGDLNALHPASSKPKDILAASADAVIACLWPLDAAGNEAGSAYRQMLDLLNGLAGHGRRQLVLIGREGPMTGGLSALAEVASLEHPELSVRTILLDPLAEPEAAAAAVIRGMRTPTAPLVLVQGDEVQVPRLRPTLTPPACLEAIVQRGEGLDGVAVEAMTPRTPGPGELLVRVRAAGLNFRDTLVALGAYPGQAPLFGAECAGIIEALGSGVASFQVGDRVAALAGASLASQVVVRADLAARLLPGLSFEVAAATPVAYLTADIGLRHFGKMKTGDRLLIHAATGGVGLAALTLAKRAGAEVFATASTHEKRAYLRSLGVAHAFDSRSPDFADQVLAATDGQGVRLVLNSLTGAMVGASLRTLAKDGVLVELGKREIWTPEEVAAARPDVGYHVFDAGTMAEAEPALFQACMAEILPALATGEIAPPPLNVRPLAAAQDALRWMAQAKHMGKLVLSVAPSAADTAPVRADGAYLISGGYGGVGLGSARWLTERGARRLVLIGRNGPDAAATATVESLRDRGVNVRAVHADVADREAMATVIAEITAEAPLRGIIHAAGAPHNSLVRDLDVTTVAAARRGKVQGAEVLRRLTKGMALDFVVLCTAAANLFGAPGQGAYAAANAELEALGRAWRRDGTPVSSIAWGPWRDSGMFAAMSDRVQANWKNRGLIPMGEAEAFAALDRAIAGEVRQALAAEVDWPRALADEGLRWNLGLFAAMQARKQPVEAPEPAVRDGLAALRALPGALRRNALVEAIGARARTVLDLPKDAVLPPAVALKDLGLDSLMAVELRNHLARFGGVALPATVAFDHPTLDALADRLGVIWSLQAAPTPGPKAAAEDDLEGLSDEDVEALLAAELNLLSMTDRRHE